MHTFFELFTGVTALLVFRQGLAILFALGSVGAVCLWGALMACGKPGAK